MERDSSYTHFLLDGQLAVIDDYLEIRPENEDRLRALTAAGRITVGPWYILMDEFLVSGETIIRNLQAGIRRGSAFGGVMEVGYLPDMFGHVAQMPQILLAGRIRTRRGVAGGALGRRPHRLPLVRARRLERAGRVPGGRVRQRGRPARRRQGAGAPARAPSSRSSTPSSGPDDPLLLMNGTDHQRPQPWLGRVVAEANQIQDEFELTISLPARLPRAALRPTDLPEWHGELRSGARSNLLMGVGSNRVDVKQAAARAERSLERLAEPLSALFLPPDAWPAPFLDLAWTAHDPQRRPRLDLRLLGRRRGGRRAPPLRRGPPHRRGPGRRGRWPRWPRPWPIPGRWWSIRRAADRGGLVEVVVHGGRPARARHPGAVRAGRAARDRSPSTARRSATCSGSSRGPASTTTPTSPTSPWPRTTPGSTSPSSSAPRPRDGVPVEEIKRELFTRLTARPGHRGPAHASTSRRSAASWPARTQVPGFGWARFAPAPLAHPVAVEGRRRRAR